MEREKCLRARVPAVQAQEMATTLGGATPAENIFQLKLNRRIGWPGNARRACVAGPPEENAPI
jgi:hypothetical protein